MWQKRAGQKIRRTGRIRRSEEVVVGKLVRSEYQKDQKVIRDGGESGRVKRSEGSKGQKGV